jgi:hypothetical protein
MFLDLGAHVKKSIASAIDFFSRAFRCNLFAISSQKGFPLQSLALVAAAFAAGF